MTPVLPKPLFIGVSPYPGEPLVSVIARTADENVVGKLSTLLAHIDVDVGLPEFFAFTNQGSCLPLASLLSVSTDDVASRLYPRIGNEGSQVSYFGLSLPRRYIEAKRRRVAPAGLQKAPYDRMAWSIRALSYCPETMQLLISVCPHCGRVLNWTDTRGPTNCGRCGLSLLDANPGYAPELSRDDLRQIAELVSFDTDTRARALSDLPMPFAGWPSGDVFTSILELSILTICADRKVETKTLCNWRNRDFSYATPECLSQGLHLMMNWADQFPSLVAKIAKIEMNEDGRNSVLVALRPLLKFTRNGVPTTLLGKLICDELPGIIR